MKRRIALLCVLACALPASALQGDSDALKTLLKALGSQRDVRATLLQTRSDRGQEITVNVQIVPRRGISAQVTRPLLFAGMVSFDDGTTWKNYDPELDLLRIEPSPAKFQMDVGLRQNLIEKNYTATIEREALIAGRKTVVVMLKPKIAEVACRRIYIDAENSLILRYVINDADGTSITTINTLSVDLTSPIDLTRFMNLGSGAARVEKAWGPIEVPTASAAARYVGFTPSVPGELALGLVQQAIHVVGTAQRSFVGVRLTDGMAVATVYLWAPKAGERLEDEPFKGQYDARGVDGVRVKVVGDVSARARDSLARQFASRHAGPSGSPGTEPWDKKVVDKQGAGGGTGPQRPKLVIDNESDE
jgi:outer membrane lipoprotein-sorting protein